MGIGTRLHAVRRGLAVGDVLVQLGLAGLARQYLVRIAGAKLAFGSGCRRGLDRLLGKLLLGDLLSGFRSGLSVCRGFDNGLYAARLIDVIETGHVDPALIRFAGIDVLMGVRGIGHRRLGTQIAAHVIVSFRLALNNRRLVLDADTVHEALAHEHLTALGTHGLDLLPLEIESLKSLVGIGVVEDDLVADVAGVDIVVLQDGASNMPH